MEISSYTAEMITGRLYIFALPEKRHYIKIPFVDLKRLIKENFPRAMPWDISLYAAMLEKRNHEGEARMRIVVERFNPFNPDEDPVCALARREFENLGLVKDEPIANIDHIPPVVPYRMVLYDIDALQSAHKVPTKALFIFAHDTTSLVERARSRVLRFGEIRVCCDVRYSKYQIK